MQGDMDMPMSPEAWAAFTAATNQEKTLAIVGMQFYPLERPTKRANRLRVRRYIMLSVAHKALRVAGALNGRVSITHLNMMAKHAAINLGPQ